MGRGGACLTDAGRPVRLGLKRRDAGPVGDPRLAGVVLAAGFGTRLRPLSDLRPKALCPVGGVPLLDHALARLLPWCPPGPGSCAVNAHAQAAQVARHVGGRAHVSVEEPEPLGTAGALGRLQDWLGGRDVLLTNADAWLPGGLARLVHGWDRRRVRLLVVPTDRPADFGHHRYVGAALLPWHEVRRLEARPSGLYEAMWRQSERDGSLELVEAGAVALDCGTPRDYLAANLDASGGTSVVGAGAVVLGTVTRCVVWDGAYVGPQEHLVDAVRAGDRHAPVTVDAATEAGPTGGS